MALPFPLYVWIFALLPSAPSAVKAVKWSVCGRGNVVEVTEVVVTPLRPGVTAHLNITGNLPLDITAELNPTIDINVYYGTWISWVEVAHHHGPMCGAKAFLEICPVRKSPPPAVIQGKMKIPNAAPTGSYKIVFQANMDNDVSLFCIATKSRMNDRTEAAEQGSKNFRVQ